MEPAFGDCKLSRLLDCGGDCSLGWCVLSHYFVLCDPIFDSKTKGLIG
jgi:hypothetical protein